MRYLLALLLLIPSAALAQKPLVPVDSAQVQQHSFTMLDSMVRLESISGNGAALGSGTVIDRDGKTCVILTAAHVVRGAYTMRAYFSNGGASGAIVRGVDDVSDVALIEAHDQNAPAFPVMDDVPRVGAIVTLGGYGGAGRPRFVRGQIAAAGQYFENPGSEMYRLVGSEARPGDSGGPIVFDGQLCGVVSRAGGGTSIVCQPGPIHRLLAQCFPNIATRIRARTAGIVARNGATGQTQCPGGQRPQPYGGGYQRPSPQPRPGARPQLPPDFEPANPPPSAGPTPKPPAEPKPAEIDYEKLAGLVAAKIPKPKEGVDGKDGKDGKDGANGKDADTAALSKQIQAAGFWVEIWDGPGADAKMVDKEFVKLGGTLPIYRYQTPAK